MTEKTDSSTAEQLRELAAHLHPCLGWGNGTNPLFVTGKLVKELTDPNWKTADQTHVLTGVQLQVMCGPPQPGGAPAFPSFAEVR